VSPEELAEVAEELRRRDWYPRGVPEVPTAEMMAGLARIIRRAPPPSEPLPRRDEKSSQAAGGSGPGP
jgi:hypothetical protein